MEFHPQRAWSAGGWSERRAEAHFSEQALEFKQDFPAHLVIVLSH
jgi:hypothetical protein